MEDSIVRMLKIKHLRLISAIAESGQLCRAAEMLATTQPAASRMLSEIENIVGIPLFERESKGMAMTMIGRAIAYRANNILCDLRDLGRELDELKRGTSGSVSVGAVAGAAVGFVIPAVHKIKSVSPKAEIHINVETSHLLIRDLIQRKNDFVLARLPANIDMGRFDIQLARPEWIQLVVNEDHPLLRIREITLRNLTDAEWVIQTQPSPVREAIDSMFAESGMPVPTKITSTTSLLAQIAILASSPSIAPLTSEVAGLLTGGYINSRLKILPLREPIKLSPYYLLQLKGRQLSPLAQRLKKLIVNELRVDNAVSEALQAEVLAS